MTIIKPNLLMLILVLTVGLPSISDASDNCNSLESIDWILGSWSSKSSQRSYNEYWNKVSEETYEGYSEVISTSGEKSSYESLRLINMNGNIFYLAKVSHNDLPIAFKLVSCSESTVQFENLKHDFPNTLKYSYNAADKLSVSVEGKENSGFKIQFARK
ncbi:DUF6265 family protein [Microbulbifer sp. 2201CG32-9]|uniref:DUF6265 family protein n=1 Tax=Microbulbifer sp. 2201CG32-9 TaxID=3232309 RepID=UPI00345BC20E